MPDLKVFRFVFVCLLIGGAIGTAMAFDAAARLRAAEAPPAAEMDPDKPSSLHVETGQFVVPLLEEGRTEAFLLAEVALEMTDAGTAARHRADTSILRDIMLRHFFEAAEEGRVLPSKADPATLRDSLKHALNRELGTAAVAQVLFDRLLLQENVRR